MPKMKTKKKRKKNIHTLDCLTFQLLFPVLQEVGVSVRKIWRGRTERPLRGLGKHDCIAKTFSLPKLA